MDLQQAIDAARPNDAIQLTAGRYGAGFIVEKPLTFVAQGQVVFDGQQTQRCFEIRTDSKVVFTGITFVGGSADGGGCIWLERGTLEISNCIFRFSKAPILGGGALYVSGGAAIIKRSRFEGNTGRNGGAIHVTNGASVTLDDSAVIQNAGIVGGAICVSDGATVVIRGSTIADNRAVGSEKEKVVARGSAFAVVGSTSQTAGVSISTSIIADSGTVPWLYDVNARIEVTHSLLPNGARENLLKDNKIGAAGFVMTGDEPYSIEKTSVANGIQSLEGFAPQCTDINGKPRAVPTHLGCFSVKSKNGSVGF
jgi:predicted outer membrane repeat protein